MNTHLRKTITAILVGAVALGGTAVLAGEGGGHHAAQRAKLKAAWAEARARDAASPDAGFVERLFGGGQSDTKVATAQAASQPKKN